MMPLFWAPRQRAKLAASFTRPYHAQTLQCCVHPHRSVSRQSDAPLRCGCLPQGTDARGG